LDQTQWQKSPLDYLGEGGEGVAMEKMQLTVHSDSLRKGEKYYYAKTVDDLYFWKYSVHSPCPIGVKAALTLFKREYRHLQLQCSNGQGKRRK
jgi:hypothetical protein